VPARDRHGLHDELPDLLGQLVELLVGKTPKISWGGDRLE